jgi:chromate transporter
MSTSTTMKTPAAPAVSWSTFLKDVFVCSLGAYGGPEAHFSVLLNQLVVRKKHLTEEELIELMALCSILPGPTSTQTIVAVGHKIGGPWLGLVTMIVWALPALVVMAGLSFLYQFLAAHEISRDILRFIGPMAVGFIIVAAVQIGRKVVTDRISVGLALFGAIATGILRSPWIFPAVLIAGGAVSIAFSKERDLWNRVRLEPPWRYLVLFIVFALGGIALIAVTDHRLVILFESFYRYGYLVFGGGQVVVPVMHGELVEIHRYMTDQEFLIGYGLVQGLPGPMFSFAAYAGGMAARGGSTLLQVLGAVAGGVGIFLPGVLLIYFVYPVWEELKGIKAVRVSLKGINAVAGGMIAVAAVILMAKSGITAVNIIVVAISVALLFSRKVPATIIVLAAILAGFLI